MLRNWLVVYLGNFAGAVLVAALCVSGHVFSAFGGKLAAFVVTIAQTKAGLSFGDAFVRGMHIDDDQSFGVLGEHVDTVQLRDGVAQRRHAAVGGRRRQAWATANRRRWLHSLGRRGIQRGIRGRRFGNVQAQRRLP